MVGCVSQRASVETSKIVFGSTFCVISILLRMLVNSASSFMPFPCSLKPTTTPWASSRTPRCHTRYGSCRPHAPQRITHCTNYATWKYVLGFSLHAHLLVTPPLLRYDELAGCAFDSLSVACFPWCGLGLAKGAKHVGTQHTAERTGSYSQLSPVQDFQHQQPLESEASSVQIHESRVTHPP